MASTSSRRMIDLSGASEVSDLSGHHSSHCWRDSSSKDLISELQIQLEQMKFFLCLVGHIEDIHVCKGLP
jgi:hypothetical protein